MPDNGKGYWLLAIGESLSLAGIRPETPIH